MLPSDLLPLLGLAALGWLVAKIAGTAVRNLFQWVFVIVAGVVIVRRFPELISQAERIWTQLLPVVDSAATVATARLADLINAFR